MRSLTMAIGIVLLAVVHAPTAGAKATPQLKVTKVSCVFVAGHVIWPLSGNRYEADDGKVRCAVAITVPRGAADGAKVTIVLQQDGKAYGQSSFDVGVAAGAKYTLDVEQALTPTGEFNGCMDFEVVVTVGPITRKVTAKAYCPD